MSGWDRRPSREKKGLLAPFGVGNHLIRTPGSALYHADSIGDKPELP
jgi:hypothetical protein